MKVVILAGGFGSRLGEYTIDIPKPMVKIGHKPILWHIMKRFDLYGHRDFYLALGYKSEVIKRYFVDFNILNSNFTVDLKDGSLTNLEHGENWKVSLVNTGLNTMTGGRLKKMKDFVGNEPFLLTYGDGVSNININELINFHKSHGKLVTITAVHPIARFGELQMQGNLVEKFAEKPQTFQGWVNGGFFVMEPEVFDYIDDSDETVLEKKPLENIAKNGQLVGFKYEGFWQCMDTKRDKDLLESFVEQGHTPWLEKK